MADAQIAEVRLYTLDGCGACWPARRLLRRRGIPFEEVQGDAMPGFRDILWEATGSMSVPQILIDGEPIGGADSLLALDRLGVLLPRVRREPFPIAVVRRRRRAPTGFLLGRPRSYEIRLIDRDGRTLERAEARSSAEAESLAEELQATFSGDRRQAGAPG